MDWGRHELDPAPSGPAALVSPAAVLVVAAAPGRRIPEHVRDLVAAPDPGGLPFRVRRHHHWRSHDGDLLVGVWEHHEGPEDAHWRADGADLAVLVGRWRRPGGRWETPVRSVAAFAELAERMGLAAAATGALGTFVGVTARADGTATVVGDPLGFASLLRGDTDQVTALASSAALCARALAPAGARPARDPLGPAWHALAPHPVGDRTGFAGVRQLPGSTAVALSPGRRPRAVASPAPTALTGEKASPGTAAAEAALDAVQAAVADELRAALAVPAPVHHLDLTGGKDSRLVLAVAVAEGLADRFVLRTAGPPTLGDVQVATDVASRLGLRHETGNVWPGSRAPYGERVARFLAATGGMANVWNLKAPRDAPARVRVSGQSGECLRAQLPVRPRPASLDAVVRRIRAGIHQGSLGLVVPEVLALLDDELDRALGEYDHDGPDPLDLVGAFNVRHRAGPFRRGMDDLESDVRAWPLVAPAAVAAAFSLDAGARQDEVVHRELIARAGHGLVDLPFAGTRWPPPSGPRPAAVPPAERPSEPPLGPPEHEPGPSPVPQPPTGPGRSPERPASGKATPLAAHSQGLAHAERDALVDDVLADAGNPAWEVLDRTRALDARARYDELAAHGRRQLLGAVTLALWLAEG